MLTDTLYFEVPINIFVAECYRRHCSLEMSYFGRYIDLTLQFGIVMNRQTPVILSYMLIIETFAPI